MARHEAQPEIARNGVEPTQKVGKVHLDAEVLAVGVDVLSEERYLLVTGRYQLAQLLFDFIRHTAALSAAHIRHDAVSAEVIAAVHDGKPCFRALGTQHRQTFRNVVLAANVKDALFLGPYTVQQRRKAPERVRAEQEIYLRIAFLDFFDILILLRHAAAQRNDNVRTLFLEMAQCADIAECAVLCVLTYRAGVEQNEIRLFGRVGHCVSHLVQHAADAFGVRFVLLTAEGVGIRLGATVAVQAGDCVDIGKLRLQLFFRNIFLGGQDNASSYRNGAPSAVNTFMR